MTDPIPQAYLIEAVRRLNDANCAISFSTETQTVRVLARTLQELGWEPPVDPVEQRAKEICARLSGWHIDRCEDMAPKVYQAALIALRDGLGK